jgi:hypothetical protein
MGDLLIRDLPARTHEELKRRAQQEGTSLQSYVARILERSASTPSLGEWLRRLDELPRHPELSGADAIRAARDELP